MGTVRALLTGVALAIVGCGGCSAATPSPVSSPGAVAFADDLPGPWTDEQGAAVTFSRWRGGPLIVTAMFTSCTTRCPMTIERLRALDGELEHKGVHAQFALVTLDPRTDDPARLRRYKEERHLPSSWHLLRGSIESTRDLSRALGVRAAYDDGHIDHDVRIVVFDAGGRLVRRLAGWDFGARDVLAAR